MKGLYYISFLSDANPPFVSGDMVRIFYDEIGDVFSITKNGSPLTSGPNLGPSVEFIVPPFGDAYFQFNYWFGAMNDFGDPDFSRPEYQFCELTTLVFFATSSSFPYAVRQTTANHPSCAGNVCDIIFRGTPKIVQPTEPTTADGEVTIVAESSLGVVKYGFEDVPYASMPNSTGIFTGLIAGTYTIYAKDAQNCTQTIVITLKAKFNYGVKWRLQYDPVQKSPSDVVYPTKIDVLEKDYSGPIIDVKGVDEPFTLRMRGENSPLFSVIMATECTLTMLSETDLQFLSAFTKNDRAYQIRWSKFENNQFVEKWRGWVKPGLYRESYVDSSNYAVSLEATDTTVNLQKLKFADASGNQITGLTKKIDIIATILKKLDFDLPIHVADNLYETTMSSLVSDDPTDQTWLIPDDIFDKDTTCDVVLNGLLSSKGARIVQWGGAWWIIRIDELVTDVDYRIFDKNGVLQSNEVYSPLRSISDKPGDAEFTWINARQDLEIYQAVGVMVSRHNLIKVPNGIKNGGFDNFTFNEVKDAFGKTSFQITGYKGWSLVLNGSTGNFPFITGATKKDALSGYGETSTSKATSLQNALTLYKDGRITKSEYNTIVSRITKDDVPNYAIVFGGGNAPTYGNDAYVVSDVQKVTYSSIDGMKFSLDYFPREIFPVGQLLPPFIKFKISFKLNDQFYLQADGTWSEEDSLEWIEIIVPSGKYNTWCHIDIAALFPDTGGIVVDGTYVVKIMGGSFPASTWIIGDETDLRAVPTVNLPEGYKIAMVHQSGSTTIYRFYELVSDTITPDNSPTTIRPDDYGTFDPPLYNSLSTYKRGDKVKYGGAFFYVSTHDNNINHTPGLSPNDWVSIAGKVLWKLSSDIQSGLPGSNYYGGVATVTANKFDNATFEFYPSGEDAPEYKDYKLINDDDIDNDITEEFVIGDAPVDIINSKNIYQNIYRLSTGEPTIWWSRRGQNEKQQLLALLSKQYVEQLQKPRFKLTGDLSGYVNFIDSFQEKGKIYIPMAIEIRDYHNETMIEMIELTTPGQNNGFNLGEFKNEEFGTDFDI